MAIATRQMLLLSHHSKVGFFLFYNVHDAPSSGQVQNSELGCNQKGIRVF